MYSLVMPRTSLCGLENMGCSCHCSSAQKNKDYHHKKFVIHLGIYNPFILIYCLHNKRIARVANSMEFYPYPGMHKSSIDMHQWNVWCSLTELHLHSFCGKMFVQEFAEVFYTYDYDNFLVVLHASYHWNHVINVWHQDNVLMFVTQCTFKSMVHASWWSLQSS